MNQLTSQSLPAPRPGAASADSSAPLLVERLIALAFSPGRAPRSAAYLEGCQAALEYRILGRRMRPSYPAGCCEADAWLAGAEESHSIWCRLYDNQQ